jgi:hypothetical protein
METKNNNEINKIFKKEQEYINKTIEQTNLNNKIYKKFNKHFKRDILTKYKSNQYVNYLTDFVDRLINILGPKIKVQNKNIYLKDTIYVINHDYLGNLSKHNITILSSENLIQIKQKFTPLDKDVLFYKDKSNNVYVYYDLVTLQYLGYSEDNKNIKKNKTNASLIRELSILDILLTLGLENEYYNIKHLYNSELNINLDNKDLINSLIRNRIINLKQIILKFESIINSNINHSNFNARIYNIYERNIINEFKKKLKEFNLKDIEDHNKIFKHDMYIINNINLDKIDIKLNLELINQNYIDCKIFNNLYNVDCKLIYYLIMNLNKLLDYNNQPAIESELSYLIIKIIKMFNIQINIDYTNSDIRKYDYILINQLRDKRKNTKEEK